MQRRHLLQLGLGAAALPLQLWAASPDTPRLLVVFLRGAYDAANLLVPTSSSFYYEARPNIAIARKDALPLDADWGLAPAVIGTPSCGSPRDASSASSVRTRDAATMACCSWPNCIVIWMRGSTTRAM